MDKKRNSKRSYLVWFVFLLTISVVATSILTTMLMNKYYLDASGAINIGPTSSETHQQTDTQPAQDPQNTETQDTTAQNNSGVGPAATKKPYNPSFEASSDGVIWSTYTEVDIFKASYANENGETTVKSADGTKLIAPGTENTFIFKLSNKGDVPIDFTLDIDVFVEPAGIEIPVEARLRRYDGKWISGDSDSWVFPRGLTQAFDKDTLGIDRYFYYTLEWRWPFDTDDTHDTYLGNLSAQDDVTFKILILTNATAAEDPSLAGGINIPDTGDDFSFIIWGSVAICSLVIIIGIIIFILLLKRREDDEEEQNSAVEDTQIEKD